MTTEEELNTVLRAVRRAKNSLDNADMESAWHNLCHAEALLNVLIPPTADDAKFMQICESLDHQLDG